MTTKLWIVQFDKLIKVLVFAKDIDEAKIEARLLRPDCKFKKIVSVRRIGKKAISKD